MKKNVFLKPILVVLFFLAASGLQAVEKNDVKPIEKGIISSQSVSNNIESNAVIKKMTFKEKLKIIREIRKESKNNKQIKKGGTPKVILYILAVILPPVAVGIFTDWGEPTLWNLLFTICFWIPGIIHAFYILLK